MIVYFLYIYIVCDVFYYCFILCVAKPSRSFSLRALYSASVLHTQPPGSPLHSNLVIITFICVCSRGTNISCRYLLGLQASLLPELSNRNWPCTFGFRGSWECAQTVRSFSSAWYASLALNALSLTPSECSYAVSDCCTLSWLRRER